jgi:hypothetical protein
MDEEPSGLDIHSFHDAGHPPRQGHGPAAEEAPQHGYRHPLTSDRGRVRQELGAALADRDLAARRHPHRTVRDRPGQEPPEQGADPGRDQPAEGRDAPGPDPVSVHPDVHRPHGRIAELDVAQERVDIRRPEDEGILAGAQTRVPED